MGDGVILDISEAIFPSIYEPLNPAGLANAPSTKYGLCIKAEELPSELLPWANAPSPHKGVPLIGIYSNIRPIVVNGDEVGHSHISTTLRCARDANLRLDDLLVGIPLQLAVKRVEFSASYGSYRHRKDKDVRMLSLYAIRVNGVDLNRRYDELCAQYFTGG